MPGATIGTARGTGPAAPERVEREPEHADDTPLRPVENAVETGDDDRVLDDDADFTDQRVTADVGEVVEAGAGDQAYFAPTDPVVRPGRTTRATEIAGGFAAQADVPAPERSATDGARGDEAIADAVRDALALDASTAGLGLGVEVVDGVVHLRGTVAGPEDGESAEAVAGAVPGVVEVADDTEILEA